MAYPAGPPQPLSGAPLQLALLAPPLVVFLFLFAGSPIVCGYSPVDLPFSPSADVIPPANNDLTISLLGDGTLFIDTKCYAASALGDKLLEIHGRQGLKHIVIRADRSVPFRDVRLVLFYLRAAGFTSASLITFDGSAAAFIGSLPPNLPLQRTHCVRR